MIQRLNYIYAELCGSQLCEIPKCQYRAQMCKRMINIICNNTQCTHINLINAKVRKRNTYSYVINGLSLNLLVTVTVFLR